MPDVPLSERCSLMSRAGGPPPPKVRPPDCPRDAAYIKSIGGGSMTIPGDASFPIVFEGGDGDDKVTIVGQGHSGVLVHAGGGNNSLVVESEWTWLADRVGPHGVVLLLAIAMVFTSLVAIVRRALGARSGA